MRVLAAMMILLCCPGCRAPAGGGAPVHPAEPPAATPPAEETMTYVSGASAGAPPATDDSALETDAAVAKKGRGGRRSPGQGQHDRGRPRVAVTAADGAFGGTGERLTTPALVPAWPASKRALLFVVYPLTSSKAGINRFVVGAPIEVTVDLIEGTTITRKLKRSTVLGDIEVGRDSSTVRQNIETAEQTLIELLLKRRSVDRSLVLLDGYRE